MATTTITRAKRSTRSAPKTGNPSGISKTKPLPKSLPPAPRATTSPALEPLMERIQSSSATPFAKRVYATLLQVPAGHFTTYGAMAAHLGSSPRAVGSAMCRNPLAPAVPCHRVVASGGSLGGFKGKWPKGGAGGAEEECGALVEKRALLRGEGVRFDGEGKKVLGSPFVGFV